MINPQFQRVVTGRLVSNFGDSLYAIAIAWFIAQSTAGALWLGIYNAALFAPNMIAFLFGKYIDSHSKRNILILLEVGQLVGILVLLMLNQFKLFHPAWVCIVVFCNAMFSMNTYTTQDSLVPSIVPKRQLERAQAIMSSSYNAADILFNAFSGFLVSVVSMIGVLITSGSCFLVSALVFKGLKRSAQVHPTEVVEQENGSVFEGFKTIYRSKVLLVMTGSSVAINFMFAGANIYLILIAKAMHTPMALGMIYGLSAVGTIFGSLYVSTKVLNKFNVGKKLWIGQCGFGILLLGAAPLTNSAYFMLPYTCACLFLGITYTAQNPIIQSEVAPSMLGRVFSAKYSLEVGIMPIASLIFGVIGTRVSALVFFICFGMTYVLLSAVTLICRPLRDYAITQSEDAE